MLLAMRSWSTTKERRASQDYHRSSQGGEFSLIWLEERHREVPGRVSLRQATEDLSHMYCTRAVGTVYALRHYAAWLFRLLPGRPSARMQDTVTTSEEGLTE